MCLLQTRRTKFKYVKKFSNSKFDSRQELDTQRACSIWRKPNETGARLETSPRKSLLLLSCQTDGFESSAITATRLLHLHPYQIAVVHEIHDTKSWSKGEFCKQVLHGREGGTLKKDCALVSFSDAVWFRLSRYAKSQKKNYHSAENPMWMSVSAITRC